MPTLVHDVAGGTSSLSSRRGRNVRLAFESCARDISNSATARGVRSEPGLGMQRADSDGPRQVRRNHASQQLRPPHARRKQPHPAIPSVVPSASLAAAEADDELGGVANDGGTTKRRTIAARALTGAQPPPAEDVLEISEDAKEGPGLACLKSARRTRRRTRKWWHLWLHSTPHRVACWPLREGVWDATRMTEPHRVVRGLVPQIHWWVSEIDVEKPVGAVSCGRLARS